MTFEEEFSEAYQNWEIDRLYLDLADAGGKSLSPNAKIFLRGVLCANSPNEIAKKLNYQSKNISDTVRQTLSKEVYPAIENLVNSGNKINWRKTSENSVSRLLKDYRKKLENLPPTPTEIKINWREVCAKMLEKQQTTQQLRRKATQIGCEVEVFVKLGLVERKLQQRHSENNGMEKFREKEVITRTYEYDEFLLDVIQGKKNKFTAIVGEAGSGKTTWLDKIATYLKNTNHLYICIPLGDLQGKTLEEYILKKWLPNAMFFIDLDIDSATLEKLLTKLLQKNEVWLLLDGVDEIGESSAGKTLRNIQQQLTGFLNAARVVLTCRTNVWDVNFNNPLSGFETYKTLEFKFEQVDDFIHQWFVKAENEKRGKKLEEKLKESRHERIYDLVRNPLRLSLLCQIFYFDENAELPETKAGLYQQFIRYFYEWKPEKIDIDWNVRLNLKNELHQALGRVALAGLDSSEKFRLSESLIYKEIQDYKLLKLALDLDLLVLVDEKFKTDKVYTFFHRTFQEYFASLVIPNWEFLFNHIPGDVSNSTYRIFNSYWQEVALMWMEGGNCSPEDGKKFLKIFNYFKLDECLSFYGYQILPFVISGFYITAETSLFNKEIFSLIHSYLTKPINLCYEDLLLDSLKVLPTLDSNILNNCVKYATNDRRSFKVIKFLSRIFSISQIKESVIAKLVDFLHWNDSIVLEAAKVILQHENLYPPAITRLVELFLTNQEEKKCLIIINILLKTKSINTEIISQKVLEKLLVFLFSEDYDIRLLTTVTLAQLSNFNVMNISDNDELLEIIISAMIQPEVSSMIILNLVDLLEKLEIKNETYDEALLYLVCSNGEFRVFLQLLKVLEKRNLNLEMINQIITVYSWAKNEEEYLILIYFIEKYSLSNPHFFNEPEILKNLLLIPRIQWHIHKSEDIFSCAYRFIVDIISRDKSIFKALETLHKYYNDTNIIELADIVLNEITTNKLELENEITTNKLELENEIIDDSFEANNEFNQREIQIYEDFKFFLVTHKNITSESVDYNFLKCIQYGINTNDNDTIKLLLERITFNKYSLFRTMCLTAFRDNGTFLNVWILEKIIEFFSTIKNNDFPIEITILFKEITELEQLKIMVTSFKEYVQDKVPNDNFTRYIAANEIVWHCAQHMSYPDFYNAWHSATSTTYPETTDNIPVINSTTTQHLNLTQLPITLRQNLTNNPNLNQTIIPICIDGANFTNPDNPAPDIYIEMIEKGCPEITPTPTTMSSLKTYLRLNLKKLDKQIALIFYTSKSDRSFSETFITSLSTLGNSIYLISDQKCDNIESISPHHPNLIDNIIKWLRREILEA
ncbi:MAG: NACHT domain-containing protein [Okeania sp. SIO2C9]|uniref:NACHT domain-containing protein n=1 Tax=Okeania sp. SIO2C9 TaxID=2607791 RepID=UPI0013C13333|nr:NACHT domain-containing protein [Okeania sp. SIO2C9]NEQ76293.1 NACHT domain-containing protein [Okeania sp. SIO2C9]